MSVIIPDNIIQHSNMPESEFKLELGLFLFSKGILTMGKASEFAGIPQLFFNKRLEKEPSLFPMTMKSLKRT